MNAKTKTTNLDQMRERLATLKAELDGLSRPKWNKQKAEIELLAADIEHEEGIERSQRCCQTNANSSQFPGIGNLLGCADAAPLGKSGGAVELEI